MCHVCGFICYMCVELKLLINTRSLSNQALKSAHPSLLSSRYWPWGVFIGAGQPLQHGEVRDTNLAWVRPVLLAITILLGFLSSPFSLDCTVESNKISLRQRCFLVDSQRLQLPSAFLGSLSLFLIVEMSTWYTWSVGDQVIGSLLKTGVADD